jgi:hypothetical protein
MVDAGVMLKRCAVPGESHSPIKYPGRGWRAVGDEPSGSLHRGGNEQCTQGHRASASMKPMGRSTATPK